MTRTQVIAFATLMLAPVMGAAQATSQPIRLSFTDTPAASVLRALSNETGISIVLALKEKYPITIDVTVDSVEDALRATVSAAGLEYRRVGRTYVVSTTEGMKKALEPYSTRARFTLEEGVAARILQPVRDAFPHATASVQGDALVFVGIQDDIRAVGRLINDLDKRQEVEATAIDVVHIATGNATEIARSIQALHPGVTANAIAAEDLPGGSISLTGPASKVEAARASIAKLAAVVPIAPSVGGEVFEIYELKYLTAINMIKFVENAFPDVKAFIAPEIYEPPRAPFSPIGGQIATLASSTGGAGVQLQQPTQQQQPTAAAGDEADTATPRSRKLLLRGSEKRVKEALAILQAVDVKPAQIMVEVNVIETSPNFEENLGLRYNWSPFQFFEVPGGTAVAGADFRNDNITRPSGFGQWSRFPLDFSALLNAQVVSGEAKILANPRVQVMDNSGASIFIGDTIRARIAQSGALGSQTIEIREFPVGIILLIQPRVTSDGTITLHVNPAVSTVTSIDSDNIPQTATREAETIVNVKDGETLVLGGLIRDEYRKTVTAIPLLSQLPIVGELFKSRSTSKKRSDVIVTITPRIVKDPTEAK